MPPHQCCGLLAKSEVFKKQSATSAEQSKDRARQESNGVCHATVLPRFSGGPQRCILLKSQVDRILARDNPPALSVVKDRETPLATSTTVTVAPTMTPPLWSVMLPKIRPKLSCEKAGRQTSNSAALMPNNLKAFVALLVTDFLEHDQEELIDPPGKQVWSPMHPASSD
jgi:hypothetical protein